MNIKDITNVDTLPMQMGSRSLLLERNGVDSLYSCARWERLFGESHNVKHVNPHKGQPNLRSMF